MQTIYDYSLKQLEELLAAAGEKPYRARQIYSWLYRRRAETFAQMSDLPTAMIQHLSEQYVIQPLRAVEQQVGHDGTMKFLFELGDHSTIETVLMHFDFGESICVSSQVGCNMGCTFCASGLLKKQRNLTAGEMVGEIMYVQRQLDKEQKRIANIVIMGTGEPFDNYDNVMNFCRIVNSDLGLAVGARHITISTCGLIPEIRRFAAEHYQYNLAISLHAPNDALRAKLMPVDRAYPLAQLMQALKEYSSGNNRRLTFEYILLKGINDRSEDAIQLADLVRGMNAYVNLIPYNEVSENGYHSTDAKASLHFYDVLMQHGVKATLRTRHGEDIDAACGQLRAKHERNKTDS